MTSPAAWVLRNRFTVSPLFGLCSFEAGLQFDRLPEDSVLVVRFGNVSARLPLSGVASNVGEGPWGLIFHINTHLVENGTHDLCTRLELSDGSLIEWADRTYEVDNTGTLAEAVGQDLAAYGTPVIFGRTVDSTLYPYKTGRARAWFNERRSQSDPLLSFDPAPDSESARRHLAKWGFCVLNTTIPLEIVARFNEEIDAAIGDGRLVHKQRSGDRVYGAHTLPHGKQVWLFPSVLKFLRDWFRDEPCACQSLLYLFGSEQNAHQDTIHLTPYPAGFMCGVWVALEDVQPDSGELFVHPGSQVTERVMSTDLNLAKVSTDYSSYVAFDRQIRELLHEGRYESRVYRPKAGQILVWHENLIHGGSPRKNLSISRRSIVSHYFSRGAIAYYDSRGEAATLEQVS